MSYLLDTNVILELARSTPDACVVAWFGAGPDEALRLSPRFVEAEAGDQVLFRFVKDLDLHWACSRILRLAAVHSP